jgi:UDP-glucose 4-epimerase
VLVTGGAGFIGSHLVDELVVAGYAVRVYDDFSTGRRENLAHHATSAEESAGDVQGAGGGPSGEAVAAGTVEIVAGDVRDLEGVRAAMADCEAVVHQAAVASVSDSYERLDEVNCINVGGTVKVLRAARELGVRRAVFASSCAVYGDTDTLPIDEATLARPLSPYAVGKLAGEGYCRALADGDSRSGLDTIALRFFNVYGPRQDAGSPYSGVIAAFMAAAAARRGCVVHGDGQQTRDFVFVQDVARGLVGAVAHEGRFDGQVVNLGSGTETSVNDIVAAVRRASGAELPQRAGEARSGDIRRSRADVWLAAELLGWSPSVAFNHGLNVTWQWYARPSSVT